MIWDGIRWLMVMYVLIPFAVQSGQLGPYLPVLKEDSDWWSYLLFDPWRVLLWLCLLFLLTYWQADLFRRSWLYLKSSKAPQLWFGALLSVALLDSMLKSYRYWNVLWLILFGGLMVFDRYRRRHVSLSKKRFGFHIRRY
ncbi:MAG: hypothetical protein RBR24_08380 [Candidatus Carbobacillus sp.]|nr:hypothetical protein [Candidatus Carbobacillus sp.]